MFICDFSNIYGLPIPASSARLIGNFFLELVHLSSCYIHTPQFFKSHLCDFLGKVHSCHINYPAGSAKCDGLLNQQAPGKWQLFKMVLVIALLGIQLEKRKRVVGMVLGIMSGVFRMIL